MITIDDFKKVEMKVGRVLSAEAIAGSEKLLKLQVDLGEPDLPAGRQILSGIAKYYKPEELVGRQIVVIVNLEPRSMMGLESQGMVLAAHTKSEDGEVLSLVTLEKEMPVGTSLS